MTIRQAEDLQEAYSMFVVHDSLATTYISSPHYASLAVGHLILLLLLQMQAPLKVLLQLLL